MTSPMTTSPTPALDAATRKRAFHVKELSPKPGRQHAITLHVITDNGECASTIPNPRAYADEGGPEWVLRYGDPETFRYELAAYRGEGV